MPLLTIVPHEGSAAVVLPTSVLESAGLRIGDVLEVTLGDRQLILRPVEDAARRQVVEDITREVFERRRDAYRRLA
jgi:antitoxin component of MazEF toxin-antitoxin module